MATDYLSAARTLADAISHARESECWGLWIEARTLAQRFSGPAGQLASVIDELFEIAMSWSDDGECVPFSAVDEREAEVAALESVGLIRTEPLGDGWRIVACPDDALLVAA